MRGDEIWHAHWACSSLTRPTPAQAERWGWTPAVCRVREQYRRAIRVHRAQQRRFWRQKWIAHFVTAWRAMMDFAAQVSSDGDHALGKKAADALMPHGQWCMQLQPPLVSELYERMDVHCGCGNVQERAFRATTLLVAGVDGSDAGRIVPVPVRVRQPCAVVGCCMSATYSQHVCRRVCIRGHDAYGSLGVFAVTSPFALPTAARQFLSELPLKLCAVV